MAKKTDAVKKVSEITPKVRRIVRELVDITDGYSYLANAYAGNESESVKSLDIKFEKVLAKLNKV
jgi:hypothetical protein